jgi:Fusaric acid resistance protein-like
VTDAGTTEGAPRPPPIAWSWSAAALGAAYAAPAAVAMTEDVSRGLALAVGVLPAAAIGLRPIRRGRVATAVLGGVAGVSILVGSALAETPWLAVPAIVALAVGAVLLTRRGPAGAVAVYLGVPLVGIGLSFEGTAESAGLALLMLAGSVYAWLVSLLWPEPDVGPPARQPAGPLPIEYGVRLGLAGATVAAIGFALDLDHVGWACAAALLVMRPVAEMQQVRSVGRVASVFCGALAGILVVRAEPPVGAYSAAVVAALAALAATRGSRWYVTSAFTTFLVFLLLLQSEPAAATARLGERLAETVLGVAIAYAFGVAVPALRSSARPRPASRPHGR